MNARNKISRLLVLAYIISICINSNAFSGHFRSGPTRRIQNVVPRARFYPNRIPKGQKTKLFSLSTGQIISSPGNIFMSLLAVQYGLQPILTQRFAQKSIVKGSYVLAQDLVRITACFLILNHQGVVATLWRNWSWVDALKVAGPPSLLYIVQNYCSLAAYQNLPPITFNVLNQTKTLSAAFWCYVLMGQRQTLLQTAALMILLLSALVMERVIPLRLGPHSQTPTGFRETKRVEWTAGVLPVLVASLTSGLAGAWVQRAVQDQARNSLQISIELAICSSLCLFFSLFLLDTPDGRRMRQEGAFVGWTPRTVIPLVTNALGGIIVGLVSKYSGTVRKGFALIIGLFLSGLLQKRLSNDPVSREQWAGGVLAAVSLWMHSAYANK